jgi:hypothetical protein
MLGKVVIELSRQQHMDLVQALGEVCRFTETQQFSNGTTPGELLRIISNAPYVEVLTPEELDMQAAEERAKKRLERES